MFLEMVFYVGPVLLVLGTLIRVAYVDSRGR